MEKIVFFDGNCNLCNGFIDFIVSTQPNFSVATLQGKTAQGLVPEELRRELSSVVYFRNGELFLKAQAVRKILKDLKLAYRPIYWSSRVLPESLVNWLYDQVAEKRYKIFGQRSQCRILNSSEQSYFLP